MTIPNAPEPKGIESWFPTKNRQPYIDHITGQCGLTPKQARYLVHLWGYAYYLEHAEHQKPPLNRLSSGTYRLFLSHSEASDLFYGEGQGTPRSAGQMLNKLSDKGLVKFEKFKGSTTRRYVAIPPEFELPASFRHEDIEIDFFCTQTDTASVVDFLLDLYRYDGNFPEDAGFNIREGLEHWAQRYPSGLKVLRHVPTHTAVAFSAAFPVHPESSRKFYLPPEQSFLLHRFNSEATDFIKFPESKALNCRMAYIPSCQIKPEFWDLHNTLKLLEATKSTVRDIQKDFPNINDIYSMTIHPLLEEFSTAIGFQTTKTNNQTALRWLHMPITQFLSLDSESAILNFKYPYRV